MERYAELKKEKLLNLTARVNEASVPVVFTFLNEDGSAHDISSYDFELIVKKIPQAGQNIFKLTVGSGLTIGGAGNNELTIEITAAQARVNPNVYYWRLYASGEDHTWLSGDFEFYAGKPRERTQTETITITESGTPVTITISAGGGGGELPDGALVLSGNFNSAGDVYPSGTISKGEIFISNGAGTSGTKFGQNGAWFVAIVDNPGQTGSNWYVLYPDIL